MKQLTLKRLTLKPVKASLAVPMLLLTALSLLGIVQPALAQQYAQNFDSLTVGTLPAGWSNGTPTGGGASAGHYLVSTNSPISTPNAFGDSTDGDIAVYTGLTSDVFQYDTTTQGSGSTNYAGIAPTICNDSTGTIHYLANYSPESGNVGFLQHSSSGYAAIGSGVTFTPYASGTKLSIRFDVNRTASTLELFVWPQGTNLPSSPTYSQAISGTPLSTGYAGFRVGAVGTPPAPASVDNVLVGTAPAGTTITADNAAFAVMGKWALTGTGSAARLTTLNTGGKIQGVLTGTQTCQINFDTSLCAAGQYPDILYQIDGGNPTRVTLGSSGTVSCAFPTFSGVSTSIYSTHTLTVWAEGVFDAGVGNVNVWGTQAGALKFSGVTLDSGGSLLPCTVNPNQIECIGNSITDTVRALGGSGSDYAQTWKAGHIGWPVLTAQALGMGAVCSGYPGDDLVKTSNGGAATAFSGYPLLQTAFASVYSGVSYTPAVHPLVDALVAGTNDQGQGVSAAAEQTAYQSMLTTIRARDPLALIECVILPSASNYTSAIPAAAAATGDSRIKVHDYSTGVFVAGDFASDAVHLNVQGNAKLASRLAPDIATDMAAIGLKTQVATAASTYLSETLTHNSSGQPVLAWPPDPTATGYKQLRSPDGINYTVIATLPAGTLTYTDTAEPSGTNYYSLITKH